MEGDFLVSSFVIGFCVVIIVYSSFRVYFLHVPIHFHDIDSHLESSPNVLLVA